MPYQKYSPIFPNHNGILHFLAEVLKCCFSHVVSNTPGIYGTSYLCTISWMVHSFPILQSLFGQTLTSLCLDLWHDPVAYLSIPYTIITGFQLLWLSKSWHLVEGCTNSPSRILSCFGHFCPFVLAHEFLALNSLDLYFCSFKLAFMLFKKSFDCFLHKVLLY